MKRAVIVIAAAAVSGLSIAATNAVASTGLNSPSTEPSAIHTISSENSKSNYSLTMNMADSNIRTEFGRITAYALNPKDTDKLVSTFAAPARQRIMKAADYDHDYGSKLDAQINKLSNNWKAKYGTTFDIQRAGDVFGKSDVSIQPAAPDDDSMLISQVTRATGQTLSAHPILGSRPIALAKIKSAAGLPGLHVAMICEKSGEWKLLVPDSLTTDRLRGNLLAEFSDVNEHFLKLPSSENAAYEQVGHRVLMAVLNKPMPVSGQASAKPEAAKSNIPQVASTAVQAHPTVSATPVSSTSSHHWWQFWNW